MGHGNKKLWACFFFALCLMGCKENQVGLNDEKCISGECDSSSLCKKLLDKEYERLSVDKYLLIRFIRETSEYSDYGASLNESFSIFKISNYRTSNDFIYTKSKKDNFVYSSYCGVKEKISLSQLNEINRLENEIVNERIKNPVTGEWNISLFRWDVKKQKKEPEIYLGSHFRVYKSDEALYEYFVRNIFIHGCKNHSFMNIPELKAVGSESKSSKSFF